MSGQEGVGGKPPSLLGSFRRVRIIGRRGRNYWEWKASEDRRQLRWADEEASADAHPPIERVTIRSFEQPPFPAPSAALLRSDLKEEGRKKVVCQEDSALQESLLDNSDCEREKCGAKCKIFPEVGSVGGSGESQECKRVSEAKELDKNKSFVSKITKFSDKCKFPKENSGKEYKKLVCDNSDGGTTVSSDAETSKVDAVSNYNEEKISENLRTKTVVKSEVKPVYANTGAVNKSSETGGARNPVPTGAIGKTGSSSVKPKELPSSEGKSVKKLPENAPSRKPPGPSQFKTENNDTKNKSGALVWVNLPGGGSKLEWVPTAVLASIRALPILGTDAQPDTTAKPKNVSSPAPVVPASPEGTDGQLGDDHVLTVPGRVAGQTVRIRIRPEVHALLGDFPRTDSLDRRDSGQSSSASALTGGSDGGGEGSTGYHEQEYEETVDEYVLLRKAVEDHDPEALRLLAAVDVLCKPVTLKESGAEYPYLKEMKERLLLSRDPPLASLDDNIPPEGQDSQMMEVHQTAVGTVVKLNADGFGSHTSPTHRVESFYTGTLESRKTQIGYPKNAKTSTFITLSLLYATLLVVVCLGFVLSEVLTHNVPLYYYEAFFTYLYGVSILFLLYVFCYLLTDSSDREKKPKKNQKIQSPDVGEAPSPTQEKLTAASTVSKPKKQKTSDNDHSHGSFFLRIGAIAFGLGTMIYNGLEFGVFFEIPLSSPCYQILRGVNPLAQLSFTFMQMYFIFMNARLNIHKFKFIARFGLMHIVATNLCVWIRTLVRESLKEINEFRVSQGQAGEDHMILEGIRRAIENKGLLAPNRYLYNLDEFVAWQEVNDTLQQAGWVSEEELINRTCGRMEIMGSIVDDSAPYLYPFIVEYSLIGAAVLYIMWKHIGRNPKYIYDPEIADGMSVASRRCHARVDCLGASKGLFCGLLILVATLICLILFFVLIHREELRMMAIYLADVSHCAIMFFSIIAIFIGFIRVRHLKFFGEREEELDDILLLVSAFGLFGYAVFSAVAGSLSAFTEEPNLLVMATSILSILQVMIQMVFIKDTQRRQVSLPEHERTKPGRQVVTFLLICNLAMWVIYTFETQKVEANPVQLEFFGKLSWTILLRCTLPLAIFHRFHSSVVLASIWKNSYKTRIE